jgi:hypothetical protein
MGDPTYVNAQITDAINQSQTATLVPSIITTSGAGKAYQSISQTAAIAVQDATDNLRNVSTISTTALAVAMSQLLATGDSHYVDAIGIAQKIVKSATEDFKTIGSAAAGILRDFPSR